MIYTHGELDGSTNQTMELQAAILGLSRCWYDPDPIKAGNKRRSKRVLIYSDSAYLTNCFIQGWIPKWRNKDWKNSEGKPVANRPMWETLDSLVSLYKEVKFVHVKGHAGNRLNELADHHAGLARISMAARAVNIQHLVEEGRIDEIAMNDRPYAFRTVEARKKLLEHNVEKTERRIEEMKREDRAAKRGRRSQKKRRR